MMKKNDDRTCLVIVVSIVLLFILYQAVKFFRQPDAIRQIFDFFAAIGLCLGAAVLLMSCIILYETISTRIENRFIRQSKDYPGRCFLVKMEAFDGFGPIPDDLPEESPFETRYPIDVNVVLTNYGLWIRETPDSHRVKSEGKDSSYQHDIFRESLDNTIIPLSHLKLYYMPYQKKGDFGFEIKPNASHGFTAKTPQLLRGDQLKIILIFNLVKSKNDLKKHIQLEQPIKLLVAVVDENGKDDLSAATRLYKEIVDRKEAIDIQEDDSWMYRSRPIYW